MEIKPPNMSAVRRFRATAMARERAAGPPVARHTERPNSQPQGRDLGRKRRSSFRFRDLSEGRSLWAQAGPVQKDTAREAGPDRLRAGPHLKPRLPRLWLPAWQARYWSPVHSFSQVPFLWPLFDLFLLFLPGLGPASAAPTTILLFRSSVTNHTFSSFAINLTFNDCLPEASGKLGTNHWASLFESCGHETKMDKSPDLQ